MNDTEMREFASKVLSWLAGIWTGVFCLLVLYVLDGFLS